MQGANHYEVIYFLAVIPYHLRFFDNKNDLFIKIYSKKILNTNQSNGSTIMT